MARKKAKRQQTRVFLANRAPLVNLILTVLELGNLLDPGCVVNHLKFHQHVRDLVILTDDCFAF